MATAASYLEVRVGRLVLDDVGVLLAAEAEPLPLAAAVAPINNRQNFTKVSLNRTRVYRR